MPRSTDRQQHLEDIGTACLEHYIAHLESSQLDTELEWEEALAEHDSSSSDSDSSMSTSSDSDTSDSDTDKSDDSYDIDLELDMDPDMPARFPFEYYISLLDEATQTRYYAERRKIPKAKDFLDLLLGDYKDGFPDLFRLYLRITPSCFDDLLLAIKDHPIFHNHSTNSQMPVARQLAIALYRFSHYGNAASSMEIAGRFGVGKGTIHLVTSWVLVAVCNDQFRQSSVQWPNDAAKERAKQWVEEVSGCAAWRDGWVMVDGTLVPLAQRPSHFRNVFYDRKSNYSINVQLVSTPDLRICDYSVGLPGSQHDASAWLQTRVPLEREILLGPGEWVWADTAYPLTKWCISPYKKPEKLVPENKHFNYTLSSVRIRSEHCVGFLKGRWSSLRGLRCHIRDTESLQYATLWIVACIHLHAFAIDHEDAIDMKADKFFKQGRVYQRKQRQNERQFYREGGRKKTMQDLQAEYQSDIPLTEGKEHRETLKAHLLERD